MGPNQGADNEASYMLYYVVCQKPPEIGSLSHLNLGVVDERKGMRSLNAIRATTSKHLDKWPQVEGPPKVVPESSQAPEAAAQIPEPEPELDLGQPESFQQPEDPVTKWEPRMPSVELGGEPERSQDLEQVQEPSQELPRLPQQPTAEKSPSPVADNSTETSLFRSGYTSDPNTQASVDRAA